MKKLLAILLSGAVFLPSLAFGAAYNDVTLTTSVVINVGGKIINVSGTSAVIQTITVGTSNFTVTLAPNSYIKILAPNLNAIGADYGGFTTGTVCTGSESSLTLQSDTVSNITQTVTITPSSTLCTGTGSSGSSGSSSGGNGPIVSGGGGGTYVPYVPTVPAIPATPTVPTVSPAIPATPAVPTSGQSHAFAGVTYGSNGKSDTKFLQQVLNADPDTQIAASGAGSPGHETTYFGPATKKAVQKFQAKYGISSPGSSSYGVFGPKTKAKLNEIAQLKGIH